MSMCVRYAGDSYTYLLDSVTKDHGRAAASLMTRYYSAHGTPPGTWLGAGLAGLADGQGLEVGSFVTPVQMERLFKFGQDPATAGQLGQSPHLYSRGHDARRPVAGFDCTFTVPKSVSVLWALADPATREAIYACHRQTIADIVTVIERDVARTRIGTNGVAQVETRGVVAAAFDHWDSRANDPNLHTHLVIANRVQGPDGRWRTLDSRAFHKAAVAMSERYDATLADNITARLGLGWEYRERGAQRNPAYELTCVPQSLLDEFSRRSAAIDAETAELVQVWVDEHGRHPDAVTVLRLRQQATLTTRDAKTVHSLENLTVDWQRRAAVILQTNAGEWATRAIARPTPLYIEPARTELVTAIVDQAAEIVLATLPTKRSTWTPWNIDAEASRALKAHRFAGAQERDVVTVAVVAEVERRSVLLTPPETASTPKALQRSDGTSAFRHHRTQRYTSHRLLEAEARLLTAGRDRTAPTLNELSSVGVESDALFPDQLAAATAVLTSGRVVDVFVGPAGSGKTRTLTAMRYAWESHFGPGSVIGLAPSAAAAQVLSQHLSIACDNTAKWLVEHAAEPDRLQRIDRFRAALNVAPEPVIGRRIETQLQLLTAEVDCWRFHPGQLVILDEASLAGTVALEQIAACVGEAGAKLLLVGDWAQLSAVEAGGAFGLLVRDRGTTTPELGAARRFTHAWEREASTQLRLGEAASLDAYAQHGCITEGDLPAMIDAAYNAWVIDENAGKRSLLIAADRDTVHALNERARAELVVAGQVHANGARLHDGLAAGVGDRITTRHNDRRLLVGRGWVKNGDTWTVTHHHLDGALSVLARGGLTVTLPAEYVAAHVELGYATTAYQVQGTTVETAHAVVTGAHTTREVLYVMLSRARDSNRVYVNTDTGVEPLHSFADDNPTGREVLDAILGHVGAAMSAHEVRELEHEGAFSIRTLAAEYETLAHHAQAARWTAMLTRAGLTPEQLTAVGSSPALGALYTALRRAEAHHLPVDAVLPDLVQGAEVGAQDLAAVLHHRVHRWTDAARAAGHGTHPRLIAGLIPAVERTADDQFAAALSQREVLIESCATTLLQRAHLAEAPWLGQLAAPPTMDTSGPDWWTAARIVAAYRDRYGVTDPNNALGADVGISIQQDTERQLAAEALGTMGEPSRRPLATSRRQPAPARESLCQTPLGR
ncbi:MobF family relaxase [Pengzhenrongella phosphoraccumulans]|uniref:MobF family relaxase n=1 Tax=Pengzhenrongella phosphoraccumulans TaxID=3114394 RepID=UPI00388EEC5A